MASWSQSFQMCTLSKSFLICHSENNIILAILKWGWGCYAVNNFRDGSRNLTFADTKLHLIFIFRMACWLKKTIIFEISVLKGFFAINSGVDFIKNFQSY